MVWGFKPHLYCMVGKISQTSDSAVVKVTKLRSWPLENCLRPSFRSPHCYAVTLFCGLLCWETRSCSSVFSLCCTHYRVSFSSCSETVRPPQPDWVAGVLRSHRVPGPQIYTLTFKHGDTFPIMWVERGYEWWMCLDGFRRTSMEQRDEGYWLDIVYTTYGRSKRVSSFLRYEHRLGFLLPYNDVEDD